VVREAFGMLTDFKRDEVYDSELNWCVIFGIPEPRVVRLEDIRHYQKHHSKLEWSDLETILEQNSITEVVAIIRDSPTKEALIIDAAESPNNV